MQHHLNNFWNNDTHKKISVFWEIIKNSINLWFLATRRKMGWNNDKKDPQTHKMLWFKTYFKHFIKVKFPFLFYCIAQQYIRISVLQTQEQLKSQLYFYSMGIFIWQGIDSIYSKY